MQLTQRQKAMERVLETYNDFRSLAENSPDLCYGQSPDLTAMLLTLTTEIFTLNNTVEDIGYSIEKVEDKLVELKETQNVG